jgi:hypothetical protein
MSSLEEKAQLFSVRVVMCGVCVRRVVCVVCRVSAVWCL